MYKLFGNFESPKSSAQFFNNDFIISSFLIYPIPLSLAIKTKSIFEKSSYIPIYFIILSPFLIKFIDLFN